MSKSNNNFDFYNVQIIDYLQKIGEPIKKISRHYFQHMEHDSLKINASRNYFTWNSRSGEKNSSGGVVQYLQIMYGLSLHEALKKVQTDIEENFNKLEHLEEKKIYQTNNINKNNSYYIKEFKYSEQEDQTYSDIIEYLTEKRSIPENIVNKFIEEGYLSQNKFKEVVFKWYKGNKVVGYDKQGTVKLTQDQKDKYYYKKDYFKYISPTTEEHTMYGFNYLKGSPENIFFFESPIDLLSYFSLHKAELEEGNNFWLVSISGVATQKVLAILDYAKENLNLKDCIKSLNICFDNDQAGRKAYNSLQNIKILGKDFNKHFPKEKDWNEQLISIKNQYKNNKLNINTTIGMKNKKR